MSSEGHFRGRLDCSVCEEYYDFSTADLTEMVEGMRRLADRMIDHIEDNHMKEGTPT